MRSTRLVMALLVAVAVAVAVAAWQPVTPASGGDPLPLKIRAQSLDVSPFGPGRAG